MTSSLHRPTPLTFNMYFTEYNALECFESLIPCRNMRESFLQYYYDGSSSVAVCCVLKASNRLIQSLCRRHCIISDNSLEWQHSVSNVKYIFNVIRARLHDISLNATRALKHSWHTFVHHENNTYLMPN